MQCKHKFMTQCKPQNISSIKTTKRLFTIIQSNPDMNINARQANLNAYILKQFKFINIY